MSWRERLQKGSFRGVAFEFASGDGEFGRRVQVHEYPLRDVPWPEDLGRKARRFTLDVFVIGPDYMDRRDALLQAVEQSGPGTLVHPRMGAMQVTVLDCRLRESSREGGMAHFSLTVIEAGENRFPAGTGDTPAVVAGKSDAALSTLSTVFAQGFDVTGQPEFVASAAVDIVTDLADRLARLSGVPDQAGVTDFLAGVSDLKSNAASLVRAPGTLISDLVASMQAVAGLYALPTDALGVYRGLFDYGGTLPNVPGSTLIRQRQAANQAALIAAVQQTAVVEAARASSQVTFASFQEAAALREELSGLLDAHMLSADDDSYRALSDVRVAVVRDITERGADLARVVRWTPPATLPALVVAHRLYGDALAADGIVSRNRIRHPGFVTGGQALEVLTDAA